MKKLVLIIVFTILLSAVFMGAILYVDYKIKDKGNTYLIEYAVYYPDGPQVFSDYSKGKIEYCSERGSNKLFYTSKKSGDLKGASTTCPIKIIKYRKITNN
jgi:hypothetical protein